MKIKIITLSFNAERKTFDDSIIEAFLLEKILISVNEHYFEYEGIPFMVVFITYRDKEAPLFHKEVDVKKELAQEELVYYNILKTWRNEQAKKMGNPNYMILHNTQLVEIIKKKPNNITQLKEIKGIGEKKIKQFGQEIVDLLITQKRNINGE